MAWVEYDVEPWESVKRSEKTRVKVLLVNREECACLANRPMFLEDTENNYQTTSDYKAPQRSVLTRGSRSASSPLCALRGPLKEIS